MTEFAAEARDDGHAIRCVARGLARIRNERPRVHGLTNTVAQAFTANVLLAIGAVPTMTGAAEEVAEFVAGSRALYVNLGTMDAARRAGIDEGVSVARRHGVPWILDPAHCEAATTRVTYARSLLARGPALLRLNAREYAALFGDAEPLDAVRKTDCPILRTGVTDHLTDGSRSLALSNGVDWQDRVTAIGCAGTAIMAAFLAVGCSAWDAAIGGATVMNVAAEMAAERARGPGSFAVELIDSLHAIAEDDIVARIRLAEEHSGR